MNLRVLSVTMLRTNGGPRSTTRWPSTQLRVFFDERISCPGDPICFVLGVGIIKLLDGASTAIHRRDWLPVTWAFVILTVLSNGIGVFSSRRVF